MSATGPLYERRSPRASVARPAPRSDSAPATSNLRVVDGSKGHFRQAALPVLIGAIFLFLMTVIIPLVLNTAMASLAYEIRDQRIELAQVEAEIDSLEAKLLTATSTSHLREEAEKIGLVPVGPIGVISLEDGSVQGGGPAQ